MALSKATLIDLNSNELILDLDADTSITADTDDTIHIKIAGSDELTLTATAIAPSTSDGQALGTSSLMFSDLFLASGSVLNFNNGDVTLTHASNLLTLDGGSLDLDGEALILDADGDTKIAESSDDVIDLSFAGVTGSPTRFGAGYISLKNQGSQSYIDFYCESSNAHYARLQAPAHSDFSGNVTITLPNDTTTLATTNLAETLANKTLSTPIIAEIDSGSSITLDATTDIILDADGGDILFKDGGTTIATFTNSSTDLIIETATSDKDIIFKVNDGGSSTEVMRVDGDVSALLFPTNKEIRFTDANESVKGDGSNLILTSGGTAFTVPASDGSNGQFLKTNGSGVLSFGSVSSALDDITTGDAAVTLATSAGNITVDAQGNDTDIIFKGTDGSSDTTFLTIDGSDAGTLIANHNLELGTDDSEILFGADNEVKVIHNADKGLILKHTATADDKPVILTLQTGETDMAANDVMGKIEFQAPDEGTGTDAILVAAAIQAKSEGDFSSSSNATSLEFMTGASEAATAKVRITSAGHLVPTADDSYDLGTSSLQMRNVYTGDLHLSNMTKETGNAVDGTKGDWTIQEGADDLFLINNNSGKKYKFNLTEIQ